MRFIFSRLTTVSLALCVATIAEATERNLRGVDERRDLQQIKTSSGSNLGLCEGDCDKDDDCADGLVCFQRNGGEAVPGCRGGENDDSRADYCIADDSDTPDTPRTPDSNNMDLDFVGDNPSKKLGRCEGDCDRDSDCGPGLKCFQRDAREEVPGCNGGRNDRSRADYCIPYNMMGGSGGGGSGGGGSGGGGSGGGGSSGSGQLTSFGASPPQSRFPLQECEGDCDRPSDCGRGLVCYKRDAYDPVPGCSGIDSSRTDYCVRQELVNDGATMNGDAMATCTGEGFRLKLFWMSGYFWQEETFEREWCMRCRGGTCSNGEQIVISECNCMSQRFRFVGSGDTRRLKLVGQNLCLEVTGRSDEVGYDTEFRTCDSDEERQKFFAEDGSFNDGFGDKFEMRSKKYPNHCVTQRHHPKHDEKVVIEPCSVAEIGETSHWNKY